MVQISPDHHTISGLFKSLQKTAKICHTNSGLSFGWRRLRFVWGLLVLNVLFLHAEASVRVPIAEFPSSHISGGILQSAARTEATCKSRCGSTTWCYALDFDYNTRTCWFHGINSVCNPLQSLQGSKHLRYVECYRNSNSPFGTFYAAARDLVTCVSRCASVSKCTAADFDLAAGGQCWLHYDGICAPPQEKVGCDHYVMRECQEATTSAIQPVSPVDHRGAAAKALQQVSKQYQDAHTVGGTRIPGVTTWVDCILRCTGSCRSLDFDNNDHSCWHHYSPGSCVPPNARRVGSYHYTTVACDRPLNDPTSIILPQFARVASSPLRPPTPVVLPPAPPVLPPPVLRAPGVTICGRPGVPPSGSRIIGGDEARPHSWPWQVALRNINARSSRCAGSLVAPQWVLTTAHCVDQDQTASNWFVLAGAHDLLTLESSRAVHAVSQILIHERFDLNTFNNDVALLRLTVPVTFTRHIGPVCLPPAGTDLAHGTRCTITGWGVAANGRRPLKQATVPLVSLSTCRRPDWLGSEFTLTENMICAGYEHGGVDTCQGDSGGPLVCFVNNHWVQAGVTSFGRGCGMPQKPGVYSKVANYVGWVQNVINTF